MNLFTFFLLIVNIFCIIYTQELDIENSTEYSTDSTIEPITIDVQTVSTSLPYINVKVDLKYIKWANESLIINNSLSVLGKMNENITTGIFTNSDIFRQHAFSIYATYIDSSRNTSSSKRFEDKNSEIENICRSLTLERIPNLRHMPLKDDIVHKIMDQGYTLVTNNESALWIKEFTENFYLDDWIINRNICFVFDKNYSEIFNDVVNESYYKYLICVMPYFTGKQEKLLYSKYLHEIAYVYFSAYTNTVSIAFMVITLIVYLLLPELRRNVYGKCIVLYLVTLIIGSSIYSILIFNAGHLKSVCPTIGFLYQFFWLSNFTLQTVMCVDVYLTFSVMRSPLASNARNDNLKLFWYCLYAYSIPACNILIFLIFQYTPLLDDNSPYKIKMEGDYCYMPIKKTTRKSRWVFLVGIYIVIIAINCILFTMISILLCRHSKITRKFKGSFRKNSAAKPDKFMIRVHFRLFFVMGVMNWFLEIILVIAIDTASPQSFILKMVDSVNIFVGIIFFILLVCNKRVYYGLLAKYFKSSTTAKKISTKQNCDDQSPNNKIEEKSLSTKVTDVNTDDASVDVQLTE